MTSMPSCVGTHHGNFCCHLPGGVLAHHVLFRARAFETSTTFHVVAKSHWTGQWFIQANQDQSFAFVDKDWRHPVYRYDHYDNSIMLHCKFFCESMAWGLNRLYCSISGMLQYFTSLEISEVATWKSIVCFSEVYKSKHYCSMSAVVVNMVLSNCKY